jgi:hypothetical protein
LNPRLIFDPRSDVVRSGSTKNLGSNPFARSKIGSLFPLNPRLIFDPRPDVVRSGSTKNLGSNPIFYF